MPSPSQLKALGSVVKEARIGRGWTQKQLETASGIGNNYISNIERGYVNPKRGPVTPSDDVMNALSKALGISASDLHAALGRVDDEYQYPVHHPLHSIIRDIGLNENDFTGEDLTAMQSCVQVVIQGYAYKKQLQKSESK